MSLILQLLELLIALPKIGDQIGSAISQIVVWWVQKQTNETLGAISDAAALAARAQSTEDRYAAAQAWQKAFARPRVTG